MINRCALMSFWTIVSHRVNKEEKFMALSLIISVDHLVSSDNGVEGLKRTTLE